MGVIFVSSVLLLSGCGSEGDSEGGGGGSNEFSYDITRKSDRWECKTGKKKFSSRDELCENLKKEAERRCTVWPPKGQNDFNDDLRSFFNSYKCSGNFPS